MEKSSDEGEKEMENHNRTALQIILINKNKYKENLSWTCFIDSSRRRRCFSR